MADAKVRKGNVGCEKKKKGEREGKREEEKEEKKRRGKEVTAILGRSDTERRKRMR